MLRFCGLVPASQDAEDRFFAGSPTRNVDGFPVGQGQMTNWIDHYRPFGERCERRNGRLLTHVSTVDTVRDLDLMRRRAGERKLNYVGTSYGTIVGAVYANVFPRSGSGDGARRGCQPERLVAPAAPTQRRPLPARRAAL